MSSRVVVSINPSCNYPISPPFDPQKEYVKVNFDLELDHSNYLYSQIWEVLSNLLYSDTNRNKEGNPLLHILKRGDTVVIKPNMVVEYSRLTKKLCDGKEGCVVHGSVLRPLIDLAYDAIGDSGRIIIGEVGLHHNSSKSFDIISQNTGILETVNFLKKKGVPIEILDLRSIATESILSFKYIKKLKGDPEGYTLFNLGDESEYQELIVKKAALKFSDKSDLRKYHNRNKNEYLISNTILNADTVINVPKMKTHIKAGVTLSLKNIMGICCLKNRIPHYSILPDTHGDGFHRPLTIFEKFLLFCERKPIIGLMSSCFTRKTGRPSSYTGGGCPANDTIWRGILDINKILIYGDSKGILHESPQRKVLHIVDGIIAGEGEGPLAPRPKHTGVIAASLDPIALDASLTKIMGFSPTKIKTIIKALTLKKRIGNSSLDEIDLRVFGTQKIDPFKPPETWKAYLFD